MSETEIEKRKHTSWLSLSLLFIVLFYVLWAFYFPIADSFFIGDDISWIFFSATKSPLEILFSPVNYRAISGSNYTPLLGLSFKIDWMISGLQPKGYFIHSLMAAVFASIAFFLFLRLYVDKNLALAGSILFFCNPILLSVYSMSSARHYIEGIFFAFMSLWFFIRADRASKVSLLSSVFFLLASLSKEVYLMIPLIALILSQGDLFNRLKRTLPLWCILIFYLILRLSMFEGNIGGYFFSKELGVQMIAQGLLRFLQYTPSLLFGPYGLFLVSLICIIMIVTLVIARKHSKALITLCVIFIVLLVPVAPVLWMLDSSYGWSRYIFHLSVFFIAGMILWGNMILKRGRLYHILFLMVLCVLGAGFIMRDYQLRTIITNERNALKISAEEFIFSGKPYVRSVGDPWFYDGLRDIYQYLYGKKIDTKTIPPPDLQRYMSEDRLKDIKSEGYLLNEGADTSLRRGIIHGAISIEGYQIKWDLGPFKAGRYHILRGRDNGLYTYIKEVIPKGIYNFGKYYPDKRPDVFYLKAIYQSPEGWEGTTEEYKVAVPGSYSIEF